MPSTTAASPQTGKKLPGEPDSGGWDASEADTVTTFPEPNELPEPTPRHLPPVKSPATSPATQAPGTNVPPTPNSPGTTRGPYPTSPGIGTDAAPRATGSEPKPGAGAGPRPGAQGAAALPSAMREEVWAIVRAAVEEAVSPLVAKQRELEARAERAERFAEAAKATGKPIGAGIPQAISATGTIIGVPPPKITLAATPQPSIPVTAISLAPDAAISDIPPAPRAPALRSLPPTDSYGVTVMPSTRPQLNLDAVGAVDISGFDGGRRKKMVGRAVVVIILAIVVGLVTMTLLSHN